MTIELHVEPRKVYNWSEFKKQKPPYSIALDGFVNSQTQRDPKGPYANFDHHIKCDRLATRSTSEQVAMEINMGLFDCFRKNGLPRAKVFVNDADEDTCLAWWLLKNHELVKDHGHPKINRLVYCEDRLDCTAGAYPFGETNMRRKMAWIFEPYNDARFKGNLADIGETGMRNIIEAIEARINSHIFDEGKEIPLKGHYKKLGGGENWALTKETGPASRMAMYNDGIKAFAALIAEKKDGSFVYSLGRKSVWTPFYLNKIYDTLNEKEKKIVTDKNKWDGSNTIGGSPRKTGSYLKPSELQEIINSVLKKSTGSK